MDTHTDPRERASRTDDPGVFEPSLPFLPYPLSRGDVAFWLQRGERLGRAACWIAGTLSAAPGRIAQWRRHVGSQSPIGSPPEPS